MRSIEFQVKDKSKDLLPPKKRPRSKIQTDRLIALKKEALGALRSQAFEPFENNVRLALRVHVGFPQEQKSGNRGSGDLDNFVAGVCDGLKKADSEEYVVSDDSKVVKINAEKMVGPDDYSWYEIVLEGD